MNKKAMPETVVYLIIGVLVLAVILIIFLYPSEALAEEKNKQIVNQWVKFRGIAKGSDKVVSKFPPVNDLGPPREIEDPEDLVSSGNKQPKIFDSLSNDIISCHQAFERGEVDFLNSIEKDVFCFPCRSYLFSDKIKQQNIPIKSFNKYLNDTKINKKEDSLTIIQYLNNDKSFQLEPEDLEDDYLNTNKDLYVLFFAASGRGLGNILFTLFTAEDLPEDQQKKGFNPSNIIQPEVEIPVDEQGDILTSSEEAELLLGSSAITGTGSTVLSSKTARKYISKKLGEKFSQEATKKGLQVATKELSEEAVKAIAEREAIEKAGQLSFQFAAKGSSEAVVKQTAKKAVGRAVGKTVAKAVGARFIPFVGWGLTIATAGVGTYKIIFEEKPFIAKVMLVEQEGVSKICNE